MAAATQLARRKKINDKQVDGCERTTAGWGEGRRHYKAAALKPDSEPGVNYLFAVTFGSDWTLLGLALLICRMELCLPRSLSGGVVPNRHPAVAAAVSHTTPGRASWGPPTGQQADSAQWPPINVQLPGHAGCRASPSWAFSLCPAWCWQGRAGPLHMAVKGALVGHWRYWAWGQL